ncbi:Protein kinase family protein with leucine-rich repeat domain [Striga hermonthica]|uniref:Protein kinase family protein with leucine-rich repeat domain n=1 Tax=Striga hermonthica TaxID=68872 RepID=A0A9N7MMY4_STRHE|nr:Protein kinase family protein with leucine-rich repeat domain [Striga hermonthica]
MAPLNLFILLFPAYLLQINSQNLSSEQDYLLNLKQHWNNPNSLNSWASSSSSPCHWPEIECTSGTVTGLFLAGKSITGKIPTSICQQLKSLISINLSENNVLGQIPVSLHSCSYLQKLDLSSNMLSGNIPGEIFRMKNFLHLFLNGNRLSGVIPTPIETSSLEFLDLSNNQLNGSIPDDVRNLHSLLHFDLSMNSFVGNIPRGLFGLDRMYTLLLGHNNLTGQLPENLGLTSLQVLNLTHNNLLGTLPKSLGELTALSSLDLSNNQFSGDIMDDFLLLSSISVLRLCSNKFSGEIPHEFVNKDFDQNCLDDFNLCSDYGYEGLPSCPSSFCSDNKFHMYLKCNSSKHNVYRILIIVCGIGCGVTGFAIFTYLARKCWLKKNKLNLAKLKKIWCSGPATEKEDIWKMISFQKLKFNKHEIVTSLTDENLIGNGGSGKVYRVYINQTGSTYAVKSISNSTKSNHRLEKEFMAEIQTLGTIRHYNIVKLFCCMSNNNMKLLAYQYFENKSLDQWLHGNKRELASDGGNNSSITNLDWPMRLNIAIGVAQGLCYMHHDCSPPVIHRDIKSSNILLDSEFNAKIADFGLAKLLNGHGDTETASAVAGTFGYIAPEYAYTSKVNTKSDVYSFGVVLLELTTGRKAVTRGEHTNLAGWALQQFRDTGALFYALDAEIKEPIYLDQIITVFRLGVVCTATSPSNRPSMRDCLHILHNCSNNFSSQSTLTLEVSEYAS